MNLEDIGVGYTIATGRLFCPFARFHKAVEEILGRPVFTHEFGNVELWETIKTTLESRIIQELTV